jgi:hypothetical protein
MLTSIVVMKSIKLLFYQFIQARYHISSVTEDFPPSPPLWKQAVYAKRGVGGLFAGVEARMGQAIWQTLFMQVRAATANRALSH